MKLETIISFIAILISIGSFYFSIKTESRSDKLFQAQRISKIQVTPMKFETYPYNDGALMGRLFLEIGNYTGFHAYDVNVDVNWENNWIQEWIYVAARGLEKIKKNGTITADQDNQLQSYKANVESKHSFDMEPNDVKSDILFQGSFSFDKNKKKIITVRIKWKSENNAHFDKFFNYELHLTQAYGAESFTLIPILNKNDE